MISKYKTIALGLAMMATGAFTSCSDSFMADINTDDSKAEVINPNSLLTTALLQTYGDFGLMDTYRSYITGFTQQYAGGWNVTSYAGSVFYSDAEAAKLWDKYYSVGLKNLQDGIEKSADKKNINAILRIHRVYMYSILTDVYGDIPCSEAANGNATPKYDTQEEIYDWFFTELEKCVDQLGTGTDKISGDVTSLNGNTDAWKRYANSLRMRFAMRISDAKPEKAKEEFLKAMKDNNYISSVEQTAYINYLDVPYTLYKGAEKLDFRANALGEALYGQDRESPSFVCATFFRMLEDTNDPRLWRICRYYYNNDRGENRPDAENIDVTDDVKSYFANTYHDFLPEIGTAWYDNPKESWEKYEAEDFPTLKKKADANPKFDINANNCQVRMKVPMVNIDFERPQTPGILVSSAEVKFLIAEAISKGWISDMDMDIETMFKDGIRDAMNLYNNLYFSSADAYATKIESTEIEDYISHLTVDLTNNAREAINNQAYILHFTNPSECWANIRRSDYPVLKDRTQLPTWPKFPHEENLTTPLRLCYPSLEADYNKASYSDAISRLGGKDDWHKSVWWDKNPQNFQ